MHVTFGAHGDGNTWPEHGGTGSASYGAPVVGPAGLVSLLEAGLGLGGPPAADAAGAGRRGAGAPSARRRMPCCGR